MTFARTGTQLRIGGTYAERAARELPGVDGTFDANYTDRLDFVVLAKARTGVRRPRPVRPSNGWPPTTRT